MASLSSEGGETVNGNGGNNDNSASNDNTNQQGPGALNQVVQSANAVATQVRAAFQNQTGPAFDLASNLVSNQGRGRGRGRGRGQVQAYSFAVILLDSGQSSIPRGSQRNDLNSNGRIKQFQISRGAPAATTFRKIKDLFPELQRNTEFEILHGVGTNSLAPFASRPASCSARDLNTIRGQGCLYLRLVDNNNEAQHNSQGQRTPRRATGSRDRGRLWRRQLTESIQNQEADSDEELARASLPGLEDPVIAFVDDEDTTVNEVVTGGDADAGTDGDNDATTTRGTRSATGDDAPNAGVSGAVVSVDDSSVTATVPQSDDSASGLASVLSSSTGGVSITRRGVNTDGSARNVAGTGRGQGGSRGANVGSAVDGSSNDNASNGGVSGTGQNDGFVVSDSASAGGGIGSDANSNRHARGGDIVIHVSDSENAIVEVEDETHTENDEQPGAVSPALHEPMDEGSDDDVQELTTGGLSSDHEGGAEVVTAKDLEFEMESAQVCGNIVPASVASIISCLGGCTGDDDLHRLLQVLAVPCPLQLHSYNGEVVQQVACISSGRPVLALMWDDHSQGSVRLFSENGELAELVNCNTCVWPIRRRSEEHRLLQRLLPRENMQSTLALLLTKVGSVLQVLMNLTNRDNLSDAAVQNQLQSALAVFAEKHAQWVRSETRRKIREEQDRQYEESLRADQMKEKSSSGRGEIKEPSLDPQRTQCSEAEDNNDGSQAELGAAPTDRSNNSGTTRQGTSCRETDEEQILQNVIRNERSPIPPQGPVIRALFEGKTYERKFKLGASFQEVYDWFGIIGELPLYFGLHRPPLRQQISRDERVKHSETLYLSKHTEDEARNILNDSVSMSGDFTFTDGNTTIEDETAIDRTPAGAALETTEPVGPVGPAELERSIGPTEPVRHVCPTEQERHGTGPKEPARPMGPTEPARPGSPRDPTKATESARPMGPTEPESPVGHTEPERPMGHTEPERPMAPTLDPAITKDIPTEPAATRKRGQGSKAKKNIRKKAERD